MAHPDRVADPNATVGQCSIAASSPSGPELPVSQRYVLANEIARGGMGIVYRATDTLFGREVAIKVLPANYGLGSGATRRFVEEARITGQLQHPAIPPVHDVGALPDGRAFLAMKLIHGKTLDDLLGDRPASAGDAGRFVAVFEQIAQAVAFAHSQGIIHRDLKPGNVMVGGFGEVQVMDWGLAKELNAYFADTATPRPEEPSPAAPSRTHLHETADRLTDDRTQAGQVMGTPAYMPPEQARGEVDRVDRRSDVFTLGGILCAILTGKPTYETRSGGSMRQAAAAELAAANNRLDSCVADAELIALCKRCLSAEPSDRPADGGEVARLVGEYRAGVERRLRTAERERAAADARAAEQRKRRRVQMMLATAVALLLFGGIVTGWWQERQSAARKAERAEDAMRQRLADEKRESTERERSARNFEAIKALLAQAESHLRNDEPDKAAAPLAEAEKRFAEIGGDIPLQLEQLRAELAMVRELDRIDERRWTVTGGKLPASSDLVAAWSKAFRVFGIVPGDTPHAEAGEKVRASSIRDRLVTALDLWLAEEKSDALAGLLHAADPHPFRGEVRAAVRAGDTGKLNELLAKQEILNQPTGFAAAMGTKSHLSPPRREKILLDAHLRKPGDLAILMALGLLHYPHAKDTAPDRLRWYQAAVAARPGNSVAWNSLGIALYDKGNLEGAEAANREAIRLDPKNAVAHLHLGLCLRDHGDPAGAAKALAEALAIDPNCAPARDALEEFRKKEGPKK